MKPQRWFEIIVAFTAATLLITYLIPSDSIFVYIRAVLAFIFVVFLPGYCLVNLLFLGKNRLDLIESIVLSVALSLGLAGLIGLFLGLSPIGINFISITVSLSVTVLALAAAAFIRKLKEPSVPQMQVPQQVST
ncbi:MAG: DUF1616 domain-containing protein [Candidatus Bathyarchaeota archaeon]|nr:DUF1616 domain-containing protein [Candidatus Bathyarchaeota archaeon]